MPHDHLNTHFVTHRAITTKVPTRAGAYLFFAQETQIIFQVETRTDRVQRIRAVACEKHTHGFVFLRFVAVCGHGSENGVVFWRFLGYLRADFCGFLEGAEECGLVRDYCVDVEAFGPVCDNVVELAVEPYMHLVVSNAKDHDPKHYNSKYSKRGNDRTPNPPRGTVLLPVTTHTALRTIRGRTQRGRFASLTRPHLLLATVLTMFVAPRNPAVTTRA